MIINSGAQPQALMAFDPSLRKEAGAVASMSETPKADGLSLSGGYSVAELLDDLTKVRSFWAEPQRQLNTQDHSLRVEHRAHNEKVDELNSYKESAAFWVPAVAVLGKVAAAGRLDEMRKAAVETARTVSGNPIASAAAASLASFDPGFSYLLESTHPKGDSQYAADAAMVLARKMGDDPTQHAQELDKELGYQMFIGEGRRESAHPAPFIQGDVTPTSLLQLSDWLGHESESLDTKISQAEEQVKGIEQRGNALNRESLDLRNRAKSPQVFAQRKAAAQEFMVKLDLADKQEPGVVRRMQAEAPQRGLAKADVPHGSLEFYRAQMAKYGDDVEKLDWKRVLKQLEGLS